MLPSSIQLEIERSSQSVLPPMLKTHSLLVGRWHALLPGRLLESCVAQMRQAEIDPKVLKLDRELYRFWPHITALRDGQPVTLDLLIPPPAGISGEELLELGGWPQGTTKEALGEQFKQLSSRTNRIHQHMTAFAGWLMCNPDYVAGERKLWRKWRQRIINSGTPRLVRSTALPPAMSLTQSMVTTKQARVARRQTSRVRQGPRSLASPPVAGETVRLQTSRDEKSSDDEIRQMITEITDFSSLWALDAWLGPGMPKPMGLQMHRGLAAPGLATAGHDAVLNLSVPMTLPLPAADELRDMLEQARSIQRPPQHLADWLELVANGSNEKHSLVRYARLFELQHYWRVLHQRYAAACHRRVLPLETAFAKHLDVSRETVHADLQFIRGRLGRQWIDNL